jgi:hypothetical protein
VPKVEKIRGNNLPGTPRATSAPRGISLFLRHFIYLIIFYLHCQQLGLYRKKRWINNEFERIWKEIVVAKYKALPRDFLEFTEKSHKILGEGI